MSTTNSDQKEPFPNVDPDSPVHILTYGNSKKHELDFAKSILEIISVKGYEGTYMPVSIPVGYRHGSQNIESDIADIKWYFLCRLQTKGLVRKLLGVGDRGYGKESLYIDFEADVRPLITHLTNFIATNGGERELILVEPNYGFYRVDNRDKYVEYTQNGTAKKSFQFIITLRNGGKMSAAEIAGAVGLSKSNMVSDTHKRINEQFEKHCQLLDPFIIRDNNGLYSINDKFSIKQV